jgi:hypothetical protein
MIVLKEEVVRSILLYLIELTNEKSITSKSDEFGRITTFPSKHFKFHNSS